MSDLHTQAEAARLLVATLKDLDATNDEDMRRDTIEGETGLFEAVDHALERAAEAMAFAAALHLRKEAITKRIDSLEHSVEMTKAAIAAAMGMAELKSLPRPLTRLSIRPTQPKVLVTSEADIPSQFWKPQPPKLDKKAIGEALKGKVVVPGAELSNGGETLQWSLS